MSTQTEFFHRTMYLDGEETASARPFSIFSGIRRVPAVA
jgi:hypothetical protein